MKKYITLFLGLALLGFYSCKEEEFELESAPTSSDAAFIITPSDTNSNVIHLEIINKSSIAIWDFDNGVSMQGSNVTALYPFKGDYDISVTIFTQGGSASSSQNITIENEDLRLVSDPIYGYLTGGIDSLNGKTWVIDSTMDAHFGVGPNPIGAQGNFPQHYAAAPNDKVGVGLYNDRFTFKLRGFGFDMITKGEVYLDDKEKGTFPGSFDIDGDFQAPFPDQLDENFTLIINPDGFSTLSVSGNSFIGFYTGVRTYKIISISDDELFLSYEDFNDPELLWYVRLVPLGGGSGGGGGNTSGASLPIDFESNPPTFATFGGSTADVVDNNTPPDINNTSSKVLETVHGSDSTAGISLELADKFDFSSDSSIVLKIWTSNFGNTLRIKLEDKNDASINIEGDVSINATLRWVEVSINFNSLGAAADTYDKLVLFPGWNVPNAGTFFIDDIKQE